MAGPYTTAEPFRGVAPSWISDEDKARIASYTFYEDMYDNVQDTFKLSMRGSDSLPVYIPSAKIIVEATNRFLAKDFRYVINPAFGTPEQQMVVDAQLKRLFKRENFYAKFASQKRYGLIRGDAIWHVVADPLKPEGSRISVYDIDPASYFPIYEDNDLDRLVGVHLVDQYLQPDNSIVLRRQTYRKAPEGITSETTLWELGAWDDRVKGGKLKQVATLIPLHVLPPIITSIPVYHIKNGHVPGAPFGGSELKGLERLLGAVNQAISDEELTLALDGLGVYMTTAGPPVDKDGNEVNWRLGPGRVVEIDHESDFKRVSGITTVAPFLEHIKFIMGTGMQAAGVPQLAAGNVDVTIAESGIALAMHLAPLLAKNEEKEVEMLGIYDHMLYDLTKMWLPAYEGMPVMDVEVAAVVSDPMPVNIDLEIDRLIKLVQGKLISIATAQKKLIALGIELEPDELNTILGETKATTEASAGDLFGDRMAGELGGEE